MTPHVQEDGAEIVFAIDRLVVEDGVDVRDLGARVERAIAQRDLGRSDDPVAEAIATKVLAALDAAGETI